MTGIAPVIGGRGGRNLVAYNVKDYGAVADGTTDDAPSINAAILAAKTGGGGDVYLPSGTYALHAELVITAAGINLIGDSMKTTVLARTSSAYGTVVRCDSFDNVYMADFAVDGGAVAFPTNASSGIRIFDCNNVLVKRVRVTNYAVNAILAFTTTPATKSNVIFESCECDGGAAVGNNGFIIVDYDESGMRQCVAKNLTGGSGPNYGVQLKNQCRYSFIEDCYAFNCVAGAAFGNTNNTQGVQYSRVTGMIAVNCNNGFLGGYIDHNEIDGLTIVSTAGNLEGIRLQGNSANNGISGVTMTGIPSPKACVRFDDTASLNSVEFDMIDCVSGCTVGQFEGTSANNQVRVLRFGSAAPATLKGGAGTGNGNTVWQPKNVFDDIRLSVAGENLLAETMDRKVLSNGAALSTSVALFTAMPVRAGTVITNLLFVCTTLGSGLTLTKAGLYSSAGVQLAKSADASNSFTTTGLKSVALTASYTVPADTVLYVAFLCVGTTPPTLLRGASLGGTNSAAAGGIIPYGSQSAQTDLPAPATIVTGSAAALWAGAN